MVRDTRALIGSALLIGLACSADAFCQSAGETYEALPGSTITDECVFCDRAPIVKPISGSFDLTLLPSLVCCIWKVSELSLATDDASYEVKGEGMYGTSSIGEVTQQLSLSIAINGVEGIELASGPVKISAPFPVIEITVTEDGQRDPGHRMTIHLVASPKRERVDYELVEGQEGSYLVDDCGVCERPAQQILLSGGFRLSRVSEDPNPFQVFVVDFVDFHSAKGAQNPFELGGAGTYEHGGEVAITQSMSLSLTVNGDPDNLFDSGVGPLPDGVVFPDISIDLVQQNPKSQLHVYSIHLVARPAKSNLKQFRRGDPNADAKADISDAVFVLNWLFSGGGTPGCLDASDSNTDGKNDLTDAVFLLNFLFQGGPAPGKPGPDACGFPESSQLGCLEYPGCE